MCAKLLILESLGKVKTVCATERGADVLKRLASLAKGTEAVFLATAPDREGRPLPGIWPKP